MAVPVYSFTIYHSPTAYLGILLLLRAIAGLPGVELVRRPIYVPRAAGKTAMRLLQSRGLRRWSERFGIPMSCPEPSIFHERARHWAASHLDREELPARAFYAADASKRELLDQALLAAAWARVAMTTSRDGRKAAYDLPEMKEYLQQHPDAKVALDQLQYAVPWFDTNNTVAVRKAMEDQVQAILSGKTTPADAVQTAQKNTRRTVAPLCRRDCSEAARVTPAR